MSWPPPTPPNLADVCPWCGHERVPDRKHPIRLVHLIDPQRYWTRCPAPGQANPLRLETVSTPTM